MEKYQFASRSLALALLQQAERFQTLFQNSFADISLEMPIFHLSKTLKKKVKKKKGGIFRHGRNFLTFFGLLTLLTTVVTKNYDIVANEKVEKRKFPRPT